MTLRELIDALQELANIVPEDLEVIVYDDNGDTYIESHNYIIDRVEMCDDEPIIFVL